ncbi:MAG: ParB/RepB/Spo0J family partition protein [Christensenellales bacterium]|jgi:ParB family chromosome partitioning protein
MNLSRVQAAPVLRSVEKIPIQLVRPNPYQPRRTFSEQSIEELSRSIQRYGLIQPIVVRKINPTHYELIAGERRLRASKRAGLLEIEAIVQRVGEQDSAVMALIENLQRENLHFFDEAEAYRNLLLEHGLTQEDLARKIGKNQSTVANKLRILRLAPEVKTSIMIHRLTERHARTLLRIADPSLQLKLIEQIRRENLSVKATEDLVEKILDKQYYEQEVPRKKKISGFVRDGRLLMNDIKKLVKQVSESGLPANYTVRDTGLSFEVMVTIPKQPLQKAQ